MSDQPRTLQEAMGMNDQETAELRERAERLLRPETTDPADEAQR